MNAPPYYIEFENLVKEYFIKNDYKVETLNQDNNFAVKSYDMKIFKDSSKHLVEIKFYRSRHIPMKVLQDSINILRNYLDSEHYSDFTGILIVNSVLSPQLVLQLFTDYKIEIWDRNYFAKKLENLSFDLKEKFEKLLLKTQQGTDISPVLKEVNDIIFEINYKKNNVGKVKISKPPIKGEILWEELSLIKCGKSYWKNYEDKVSEILKYLFSEDLALWEKQPRTDDELSRFDMICRIASKDDFWNSIITSFNSRFILFEFKNYCKEISQNEIYTTERYLYTKALRAVAFIIARDGGNNNAVAAAKGSLKEHGKLIIILKNNDLHNMIKMKDAGHNHNDYLADKLDSWLISLSR